MVQVYPNLVVIPSEVGKVRVNKLSVPDMAKGILSLAPKTQGWIPSWETKRSYFSRANAVFERRGTNNYTVPSPENHPEAFHKFIDNFWNDYYISEGGLEVMLATWVKEVLGVLERTDPFALLINTHTSHFMEREKARNWTRIFDPIQSSLFAPTPQGNLDYLEHITILGYVDRSIGYVVYTQTIPTPRKEIEDELLWQGGVSSSSLPFYGVPYGSTLRTTANPLFPPQTKTTVPSPPLFRRGTPSPVMRTTTEVVSSSSIEPPVPKENPTVIAIEEEMAHGLAEPIPTTTTIPSVEMTSSGEGSYPITESLAISQAPIVPTPPPPQLSSFSSFEPTTTAQSFSTESTPEEEQQQQDREIIRKLIPFQKRAYDEVMKRVQELRDHLVRVITASTRITDPNLKSTALSAVRDTKTNPLDLLQLAVASFSVQLGSGIFTPSLLIGKVMVNRNPIFRSITEMVNDPVILNPHRITYNERLDSQAKRLIGDYDPTLFGPIPDDYFLPEETSTGKNDLEKFILRYHERYEATAKKYGKLISKELAELPEEQVSSELVQRLQRLLRISRSGST